MLFVCGALLFSPTLFADETKPPTVTCVSWTTQAKFVGVAYNHLVHLVNKCEHDVSCRIKTDVNPKEETVSIPAKKSRTHLTFRGSPAREFKADVTCVEK